MKLKSKVEIARGPVLRRHK